ncbi:hypothetical protein F5Y18DRAFT_436835 [Xylariaceae sp. FL1019]|nr:hypothetical protein F5Y18DRAFT_436835 [Xylariaceae sp. FL1019]
MRVAPLAILALVAGAVIGDGDEDLPEIEILTSIGVGDHLDQGATLNIKWDPNGVTGEGYFKRNSWNMSAPSLTYQTDLVADDLDMKSGRYSWTVEPSQDRYTDNWFYSLSISYNSGMRTANFYEFLINTYDSLLSSSSLGNTATSTTTSAASTSRAETSATDSATSTKLTSTATDALSTSHSTSAAQSPAPSADSGEPKTDYKDGKSPVSRGTIIGAAVGAVVGVLIIIALSVLVFYYRQKSRNNDRQPSILLTTRGDDRGGESHTVTANGSMTDFGAGADVKDAAKAQRPEFTIYYELDGRHDIQQMDAGWQPPELASKQIAAELSGPFADPDTTSKPGASPLLH